MASLGTQSKYPLSELGGILSTWRDSKFAKLKYLAKKLVKLAKELLRSFFFRPQGFLADIYLIRRHTQIRQNGKILCMEIFFCEINHNTLDANSCLLLDTIWNQFPNHRQVVQQFLEYQYKKVSVKSILHCWCLVCFVYGDVLDSIT